MVAQGCGSGLAWHDRGQDEEICGVTLLPHVNVTVEARGRSKVPLCLEKCNRSGWVKKLGQ
jgi:hypothetical protein